MASLLKDQILIKRQFQKSVRLNTDLQDSHALDGFIPLESSLNTLNQMCHAIVDHKAFAFTWIGPFGSGKSTLALLLTSLCGHTPELQRKALSYIQDYQAPSGSNYILQMFADHSAATASTTPSSPSSQNASSNSFSNLNTGTTLNKADKLAKEGEIIVSSDGGGGACFVPTCQFSYW